MKTLTILALIILFLSGCTSWNLGPTPENFAVTVEFKDTTSTTVKIQWTDNMEDLIANGELELVTLNYYYNGQIDSNGNTAPSFKYSCQIIDAFTEKAVAYAISGVSEPFKPVPFFEYDATSLKPDTLYIFYVEYKFSTYPTMWIDIDKAISAILGLDPYFMTYRKSFTFRTLAN